MPESAVVSVMRQFKRDLLNRESQQVAEMTRRWGQVERSLEGRMRDLMDEIARTATSGTTLTEVQLMQMDRYRALLAQVQTQMRQYERESTLQITAEQRTLAGLGIEHAAAAIDATGIDMAFNRLPVTAVEYMAGLAGDGSPLFDVLQQRAIAPDAIEGLTQALINGVAQGWNPRKTASAMADGLAQGLNKALVIARTEQLRVYRQANLGEMRASGVVSGYKRLSAHDERVCIGCLAADGQEVALDEDFASHVCCRCTAVPIVEGMGAADWQAGGDWFAAQEESTQRAIMGPGRYELWKSGQVKDFSQFATRTWSDTWGGAVVPTPLSELGGGTPPIVLPEPEPGLPPVGIPPVGSVSNYDDILGDLASSSDDAIWDDAVSRLATRLEDNTDFAAVESYVREERGFGEPSTQDGVGKLMDKWGATSGDNDPLAVAIQQETAKEFGLPDYVPVSKEAEVTAQAISDDVRGGLRAYVRAEYEATQEYLKGLGIEYVDVVRGIGLPSGSIPEGESIQSMILQPLSSFTTEADRAEIFAKWNSEKYGSVMPAVIQARIPRERIIGCARSGLGNGVEREIVVLGGTGPQWVRIYAGLEEYEKAFGIR